MKTKKKAKKILHRRSMVLLCLLAILNTTLPFVNGTWAWFNDSSLSGVDSISSANFDVEVEVYAHSGTSAAGAQANTVQVTGGEWNDTPETPINNKYNLTAGAYRVVLRPNGTASTGYCKVEGENGLVAVTDAMAPSNNGAQEYQFQLALENAVDNVSILPYWGESGSNNAITFYSMFAPMVLEDGGSYDQYGEPITLTFVERIRPIYDSMGMPWYYQDDYPNVGYGDSNIAKEGCGIVSLAMVGTYLSGHEYYPEQLAGWFGGMGTSNVERLEAGIKALRLPVQSAANLDELIAIMTGTEEAEDIPEIPEEEAENPETPEIPEEEAENPETPEIPEEEAENPENPDTPEEEAENPETPDTPEEEAENPETPDTPEEEVENPETSETPDEEPEDPEIPEEASEDTEEPEPEQLVIPEETTEEPETKKVKKPAVDNGKVAIILVNSNSPFTDDGHFLVVKDITEDGLFWLNDPNQGNYSKQNLADGFENGFTRDMIAAGYQSAWVFDPEEMEPGFVYSQDGNTMILGEHDLPVFYQNDYPKQRYGNGTLADDGCGITALAMVASYMTPYDYAPDELARYFGGSAENNIQRMLNGADALQLPYEKAENIDKAMSALRQGKIVIELVDYNNPLTTTQHFIVWRGLTAQGRILVSDPNRQNYERQELSYQFENGFLKEELMKGWQGAWIFDPDAVPEDITYYYEEQLLDYDNPNYDVDLTYEEQLLIAKVIFAESRGEPEEGQQAVAEVVLNRLVNGGFGNSIEGVIRSEGAFNSVALGYVDLETNVPAQAQYDALDRALYGENILPKDIFYFATESRAPEDYFTQIQNHYFW